MEAANLLDLHQVSWNRDDRPIIDGVDWRIDRGQHWALIGPNGSGKTTLLNIVTGYLWPSRGLVRVLGKTYGQVDLREVRKRLGWVSLSLSEQIARHHGDDSALDVALSGVDASIGLYRDAAEESRKRAHQLLAWLEIDQLKDRPFSVLSQGERQRVVLARAWMAQPDLLILDEPCNGLDLVARERLLEGLGRLAGESDAPATIYVTHHVEEVLPWFTHALLLRSGQVVKSGPKREVLADGPLSRTFGLAVEITWQRERPWLRLA